ncbi:MAG: PAS domain S-box protein, partial [Candidatus Obscuribacterales bacterium]|nr:PAS domain S-box protein [Candidatus Obscuribacterales bacterium]
RGLNLVGVPFILELLLIIGLGLLLQESDRAQLKESVYRKIAASNAKLLLLTTEAPYFLISSIRFASDDIFKIYQAKHDQIKADQKELIALLQKTPDMADGAAEVQENIDHIMTVLEGIAEARKARLPQMLGKLAEVIESYEQEKGSAIENLAKMLRAGEIRTREIQKQRALVRKKQSELLLLGIAANLIAGVYLAFFFRNGISARLGTIRKNTVLLSKGEELEKPISGEDEIAQLDQAFHAMDRELKSAAEREKKLFNDASDVICVLDYRNQFQKINKAAERLLGYSHEQLLSMTLSDIVMPEDMNAMLDQIAHGKLSGEAFAFENRLRTAAGLFIEVSWSNFWSRSDNLLYCVVHDVSERKRTERSKKKFLAMISQDLKKPLAAMSASVATLLDSRSESVSLQAQEKLQVAAKNLRRLLGLVNELLQVAEMDSSSIDISKERCDTRELLIQSVQEVESLAEKSGVKLEVLSEHEEWSVDPNRIVQVLVNLLSNAIKFSPAGQTVTLSSSRKGDMVEIRVQDRGRGVPESHKEKIFEKFQQVEAADGKRKAGTGLGLPICKQIIEDHGGSIGVESREGMGSCFWFMLPRDETVSLKLKLERRSAKQAKEEKSIPISSQTGQLPAKEAPRKVISGSIKLVYKGAILILIPLIFELALVGSMSALLVQVDRERKQELHYRNIAFNTSKLVNMYFLMSVGAIGDKYVADFGLMAQGYYTAHKTLLDLRELVKEDRGGPQLIEPVIELDKELADWVHRGEVLVKESGYRSGQMGGKEKMLPTIIKIAHRLQRLCEDAERKEFVSPARQKKLRGKQTEILVLGLLGNLLGALALAAYFAKDITSRLQILADNAMRLSKEKDLNPPLQGIDEIADLDQTFHKSAGALIESRKKERAVFDNSKDIICSLDSSGNFSSINPVVQEIWGYSKEDLSGKEAKRIILEDDQSQFLELLKARNKEHAELECRVKRKDESIAHMLWSYSRPEAEGEVFCVIHDISNLKELERIKQEFLQMVSHDLRTPLTSVLGISKLTQAGAFGKLDETAKQILSNINKSGDQLLELINDLLDIEKLEAGKMQLVFEECKLQEIMAQAKLKCYDPERVRESLSPECGKQLLNADRDRLQQALSNVLNFAIDNANLGTAINFTASTKESELEIFIENNAEVLSKSARLSLFDRIQSEEAVQSELRDRGLALAIALKIIEALGGKISVLPKDKGNSFQIRLPL